ncbi:MAG: helicase associated domain-containing protein [Firmicutes bacterium]|nr:helicase associated domain-containing protein [Bacillota bacterium]
MRKKWDKFFSLLCDYIKENGTVPMSNAVYKDSFLGNWYSAQLRSYRKGTLSKDRIQKFWNAKIPMISAGEQKRLNNWFMYYNTYLAFLKEYKRIPRYKEHINGFALYKWGYAQVDLLKHNKLNDMQQEMLKKIGITESGISIEPESIIDENIVLNSENIIKKSVNKSSAIGFDMNFMGVNLNAEYNVNDEGYEIHQLPMDVTGKEMSVSEFLEEFNNFVGEDKLTEEGVKEKIKKNYPIILWNDKDNFFDSIKFVLKRVYFDIRASNTGETQTVNVAYNFSFLLRGRNSNIPNLTPFKVNNLKFNVWNTEI